MSYPMLLFYKLFRWMFFSVYLFPLFIFSTLRSGERVIDMSLRFIAYIFNSIIGRFKSLFRWCPSNKNSLADAEKKVLAHMAKPYKGFYVDVGTIGETKRNSRIWTVIIEPDKDAKNRNERLPLVLVHGVFCGTGMWILNLEDISKHRRVYSMDILGFGRSSRPMLTKDAWAAEQQMVESIERWRQRVGLERFILLGHSLGGFISSAYALKYPERVAHLILADPWGYTDSTVHREPFRFLPWIMEVVTLGVKSSNQFAICNLLRAGGILSPLVLQVLMTPEVKMFSKKIKDKYVVTSYFYHNNVRRPGGEVMVKSLVCNLGWATHPMERRILTLPKEVGITFIFGKNTFIAKLPAFKIMAKRSPAYVNVKVIPDCGHNLHYEKPEEFNQIVVDACLIGDERDRLLRTTGSDVPSTCDLPILFGPEVGDISSVSRDVTDGVFDNREAQSNISNACSREGSTSRLMETTSDFQQTGSASFGDVIMTSSDDIVRSPSTLVPMESVDNSGTPVGGSI